MTEKIYDVIIIGGGPAGLAAGSYAGRSRMSTLIIEKEKIGGQIVITADIENYPGGVEGDSGPSLIDRMAAQADRFGAEKIYDTIVDMQLEGDVKKLVGNKGEYLAKSVILATGAFPRPIGCPGEKELVGKGVSYCATCDAAFFEDMEVYVVGGGDAAVEEAIDGLSRVTNPIVIYQANEAVALNGSYIETGTYNGEVIYGCDESTIRSVAKKYSEQLGSHYFMLTNVGEDYIYSHSFLVKLISFISSLCVLVLLLDIAIIVSEAKMEFRLSSMEISLKKVLGYSFYERHKRFISVNLIENIAVVILICIVSIFISNASVGIALLIGALLTIIEMAIIFTNIMWVEKTNISKSLKGGCL